MNFAKIFEFLSSKPLDGMARKAVGLPEGGIAEVIAPKLYDDEEDEETRRRLQGGIADLFKFLQ